MISRPKALKARHKNSLYIKNQYQHHQKQNFQDEFKKFLAQHEIAYDEKYLWA